MSAVNPILALVAPSAPTARSGRPDFALQDLLAARTPENTGLRSPAPEAREGASGRPDSFASELEKGLEQQQEHREPRRAEPAEARARHERHRKEAAADDARSGNALPADGRDLPPPQPAEPAAAAPRVGLLTLEEATAGGVLPQTLLGAAESPLSPLTAAAQPLSDALTPAVLPEPVSLPNAGATSALTAEAAAAAALQAAVEADAATAATPAALAAEPGVALPAATAPAAETVAQAAQAAADALQGAVQTSAPTDALATAASGQSVADSALEQPGGLARFADPALNAAQTGQGSAAAPAADAQAALAASSNPFAALTPTGNTPAAEPQAQSVERQTQSALLAQTQAQTQPAQADAQAAQGDLAERVRAWRGLSAPEGLTPSLFGRGDALNPTPAAAGGQLQQFADSLRQALNLPEAASLFSGLERGATSTASLTASVSAAATSTTALGSSTASPGAATPVDASGAWRGDGLQTGTPGAAARPAAGTLSFMQTMQPSNFGAPLDESFGQNAWAESVTRRVALMTGQTLSSARIELDPPELGAMTVKVSVSGDQASVSFASPHAIVRDALEQTFPRLQEMLSQQGLQLADAQVSDESSQRRDAPESGSGQGRGAAESGEDASVMNLSGSVKLPTSLIDYYA